jgi:fructose-1,6-bisphosphatase I
MALIKTSVRWYASEEQEIVVELDPQGHYALAIDPLDGSSNIDVNVSIGTIFSIFEAKDDADASFLRPASEQIAAGYVIYGPQTALVITFGSGVLHYVLDPDSNSFVLVREGMEIPANSSEFAINASNYRHWSKPIRAYIDDCLAGSSGPRAKNFNMRLRPRWWPKPTALSAAAGSSSTRPTSAKGISAAVCGWSMNARPSPSSSNRPAARRPTAPTVSSP